MQDLSTRTYTQRHGFFDDLVAFLVAVNSLVTAIRSHQDLDKVFGSTFGPNQPIYFQGKATGVSLRFYPYNTLQTITKGRWPKSVEVHIEDFQYAPTRTLREISRVFRILGPMIQSAFISYYEQARDSGRPPGGFLSWPTIWQFGKVVRDALTHDGRISILDPRITSVTWRSLRYSAQNNGRRILYRDVTPVDLILLMEEMDAAL